MKATHDPDETKQSKLHQALAKITKEFMLDAAPTAFSAETGTDSYGPENIVGVGIAKKIKRNRPTSVTGVTVFVVKKAAVNTLSASARIPKFVNGVETDVVETGEFHYFPFRGRYRPVPGGVSVGHHRISAGTVALVVAKEDGSRYILSNNHVLANCNNANAGDPILQPGSIDGGRHPADTIGSLSAFLPLLFGGTQANTIDAAIAAVDPQMVISKNISYGAVGACQPAKIGMKVKKSGRTTQLTDGQIQSVNTTVRVNYGANGIALFTDQIVVVGASGAVFSQGGDSGSLIVTKKGNHPVGLLFAGSPSHTLANHIAPVLSQFGVSIL